jgi:hypothetical protein
MPAIYHLFLLRKSLIAQLGGSVADEILPKQLVEGEGVKKDKRALRTVKIMKEMDLKLSGMEVKKIRRSMSCYLTKQQIEIIDRAKENDPFLERQIEMINSGFTPSQIEMIEHGYNFYFNRPGCICRVFSKLPDPSAPASFCECCGGNILRIFKYWLNKDLEIEMTQTFLTGGNNCVFKLTSNN